MKLANRILLMLVFVLLLTAINQQRTISIQDTRISNYQTFILLHAYKQDHFTMPCKKCRYKNVIPLYADTSIFQYSKEIKAIYPTLIPTYGN